MNARIKRITHGKWHVFVGDRLIREEKTKREAQEFAKFLRRPGVFIDASDGYGDSSYFENLTARLRILYPAKKLPDAPLE